jgi:uncharacterized protein
LGEDNRCAIYETRPLVCRVDEFFEGFLAPRGVQREDWHRLNHEQCNAMQAEDGMSEDYRVRV